MFRASIVVTGALLIMSVTSSAAQTPLPQRRTLTLEAARTMAAAAEAEAQKNNWQVAIAIVDDGGRLILFQRSDGVVPVAIDIAIGKARTAAHWKRETRLLEEEVSRDGRNVLLVVEGIMPLEGGVPLVVEGDVIGAIAVSGVTGPQDAQVAKAGAQALGKG